jgi:hypothetical protein
MKALVLAVIALALAGCEHMYGGMDAGRFAPLGAPTQAR